MQLSKDFWFRREELPWYRRGAQYLFVFLFLPAVIFLGVVGIIEASGNEQYRDYLWVPSLLTFCGAMLFIASISRLIIRRKKSDSHR
ncbi:MAG: hypothetical protein ACOCQ0_02310 [Desulfosalsimonas sp.]